MFNVVIVRFLRLQSSNKPYVGTLPPLSHYCNDSNDHHAYTEPRSAVEKRPLHGLQEMVLTGIAAVAQ